MRFGISAGNGGIFGAERGIDACVELARRAEALGYDSVWMHDHIVLPSRPRTPYPYSQGGEFGVPWDSEFHEPLVLLCALAAITRRVELGTSVLVMPLRHPAVTAKMLATADLLSGGRVVLGAGVGWCADEFHALGLPDEHFTHRGGVTDDYLRAIKEMWTNTGPSRYTGRYVAFRDVGTFPKPARRPHPPIVIGGKGPHALRRASLLGDGFQALDSEVDELAAEVEELRRLARLDRRDPDELEVQLTRPVLLHERSVDGDRTVLTGSVEQVGEDLRRYARAGLHHLIGTPMLAGAGDAWEQTTAGAELFAREVLPAFGGGGGA